MNKSDLINAIAEHANLTIADAGRALEGLLNTIETALKAGDPVALNRLWHICCQGKS
jgi:DNA-binding protein HU-beta